MITGHNLESIFLLFQAKIDFKKKEEQGARLLIYVYNMLVFAGFAVIAWSMRYET